MVANWTLAPERCPTGTFARAEQLIAAARYREAIRYCQEELAASPRCVTLRLWLARALLADGAGARGVAELEECLRIDPTSSMARDMLQDLGVAVPSLPLPGAAAKKPSVVRERAVVAYAPPAKKAPPATKTQAPPTRTHAPPTKTQAPPTRTQAPPAKTQAPPVKTQTPPKPKAAPKRPLPPIEVYEPASMYEHERARAQPLAHGYEPERVVFAPSPRVVYSAPSLSSLPPPVVPAALPIVVPSPVAARPQPRPTPLPTFAPPPPLAPTSSLTPLPELGPPTIGMSRLPGFEPLPLPPPPSPSPLRIAHDPPAKRRRAASRRRQTFASPFADPVEQSKPSRAASRWERPLGIEERKPRRSARIAVIAGALLGAAFLWHVVHDDKASLPAAVVVAASRPTPEPPIAKADTAPPVDGLDNDVWIHPLAGPERRMPERDSRLFGAERVGDRPSECRGGHCGVDLAGAYGEPVYAVHDGVVERVQRNLNPDHGGRYVRLGHRNGTIATQYFHLSEIPRRLAEGVTVKAGDVIGYVGLTGVKHSEPHLHFTIEVQDPKAPGMIGRYLDPEPLVAIWPLRVSPKGDPLRISNTAAPGLARGFLRRRHRPHHAAEAE